MRAIISWDPNVKPGTPDSDIGSCYEGDGIGMSWRDGIPEAIAYHRYQGDEIVNETEALAEHARRHNCTKRRSV